MEKSYYVLLSVFLFSSVAFGQQAEPVSLVEHIKMWLEVIAQLMFGLMIVATILVRVIPGKRDDEVVRDIWKKVQKVLGYLPTFGVNPRTKELQRALYEVQGKQPPKEEEKKEEESSPEPK